MELLDPVLQPVLQDDTLSAHYEVRRLLGEGGFGHVYEAWDAKLCRSVALKRLKQHADMLHPEKLLNEARLAASLRHPAFVRIFSIDGDGQSQSIVMELVEGQTLGQVMHAAPMPLDAALDIAQQIADAMDEAHAMDLVHGDLKPSNLMLEANGKVRILDFGLARQLDPQATQTTLLCDLQGTIAYMAPERLMGRLPDMRGDIYALGAMLYEMLAGQRPFSHLNGLALAAAHMQSNAVWPAMPASVPPAIDALVRSMTAHDPLERPRTMRDVREGIAAQRNASGTAPLPLAEIALPPEAPSSVAIRLPIPRKRTLQITAGIVLLAGMVAWQWSHFAPAVKAFVTGEKAQAPYSEIASMAAGMEALRVFDRDSSQANAIEQFSAILRHKPSSAAAAAGISLAYSLRYIGNGRDDTWLQRADASAQQAMAADNQLALAQVAQAWVQELQGNSDAALTSNTAALNLDPKNLLALVGKTRVLMRAKKYDSAQSAIDEVKRQYPHERLGQILQGMLQYRQSNYAAAESAFRKAIELDPLSSVAYSSLNAVLLRQDRGDEALRVLQQGLQIQPHWELYGNLGTSLFAKGDYLGAVEAFKNAVSSSKGSPGIYLLWANLGDAQRWVPAQAAASRDSYLRAITLLSPLLHRLPGNATFHSQMGLYSAYTGDTKEALNRVRQALKISSEVADVQFRAALTFEVIGNHDEALAALVNAANLGYPLNLIESAPDLLNLRREARYQQFITNMKKDRKI